MDTWSGMFILAGSISVVGNIANLFARPMSGANRERETIKKGIQRSLSDLDDETWRLEVASLDAVGSRRKKIRDAIGRLDGIKADLARAEKELPDIPVEEWVGVRDELLDRLDAARQFLRNDRSGAALRDA